ncbi:MAG: DNA polymerase III subunit gamma/tau [Gammaproteobacteria bacterium]
MSYQVLARKWRPKNFTELVGQQHVVRVLANALDQGRVHHAYLFAGTRGVGKTTVARILAKCLNCETGVSSTPCGHCNTCLEIDGGRFVDLIEVDAASRAKVDETRELMDGVPFSPARGRYKVYLIDEVHMFSNHSFNALLKTLEEPPPHVKFMLATTEPQKIPVTVLSRCLQFNLRGLPVNEVMAHLDRILSAEGITAESAATQLLAAAAEGSLRDALSLLDQAIAYGGERITARDVRSMLGTLERGDSRALLAALAANDGAGLLRQIERMASEVPDFGEALGALLSELQRIAVAQLVPDALGDGEPDREALLEFAHKLTPEDVQLYYQIGLMGRRDLPFAPDPKSGFEMILLRMLAFRPAPLGAPRSDEDPRSGGHSDLPSPPGRPVHTGARALALSSPEAAEPEAVRQWSATVGALKLVGIARELAANSVLTAREGNVIRLGVSAAHAQLGRARAKEQLQAALCEYYGTDVRVELEVGALETPTPATMAKRQQAQRQEAAVRAIHSDPNVAALCRAFDARVEIKSVRSLGSAESQPDQRGGST